MITFDLPHFIPDSRGHKLEQFRVRQLRGERGAEALLVCGAIEIVEQLFDVASGRCRYGNLTDEAKRDFTHGLVFPDGVPEDILALAQVLSDVVTLVPRSGIDLGISLDWHKEADDQGALRNTEMGRCIQFTKYAPYPNGSGSKAAWSQMTNAMAAFVLMHPLFSDSLVVTAPPGHLADGDSWGERLARRVAGLTNKQYVPMTSNGPRAPQKSEVQDLTDAFTLETSVEGRIIVIDDVFHSGLTMSAAAAASRRGGANEVLTVTVTRALRR